MESLRAGRTRYLVVVSRPVSKKSQLQISTTTTTNSSNSRSCASPNRNQQQQQLPPPLTTTSMTEMTMITSHNLNTDESINQKNEDDNNNSNNNSISTTSFQNQLNSGGCGSQFSANMTTCDINLAQCSSSITNIVDDIQHCDNESTVGSSCSSKSSSNEIEESCLLGIDCNEKTTVGLVLKVLADTAIRLDGDG